MGIATTVATLTLFPLWTFSIFDKSTVTTRTTNSFGILPF